MSHLSIEKARSARSSCKSCKTKIAAGAVRVGVTSDMGDWQQTSWLHVACFAKTKHAISNDLEDLSGYTGLSASEKAAAKKSFDTAGKKAPGAMGSAKAKKDSSDSESDASDSESDAKKKKGAKKGAAKGAAKKSSNPFAGYTAKEYETYKKKLADAEELSVAGLKAALKKNGMTQTGNKSELAARVADCQTLGTLPNCTKCGGGRLKFDQTDGSYFCKGYMDDADYVNCSARFAKSEAVRGDWAD